MMVPHRSEPLEVTVASHRRCGGHSEPRASTAASPSPATSFGFRGTRARARALTTARALPGGRSATYIWVSGTCIAARACSIATCARPPRRHPSRRDPPRRDHHGATTTARPIRRHHAPPRGAARKSAHDGAPPLSPSLPTLLPTGTATVTTRRRRRGSAPRR